MLCERRCVRDVARRPDRQAEHPAAVQLLPDPPPDATDPAIDRMADELARAARPVLILGLDLDPNTDAAPLRRFVESAGVPVFVTPKAKGIFPEDHPLFFGVCSGVAGDSVIVDFFAKADLLVGVGKDWPGWLGIAAKPGESFGGEGASGGSSAGCRGGTGDVKAEKFHDA